MSPLTLALVLAALVALPFAIGALLPATRGATASTVLDAPPAAVRAMLIDVDRLPIWRPGVCHVARTPEGWTETTTRGETIRFVLEAADEAEIRLRFASDRGFAGRWTGQLAPEPGGGTRLSVTEEATIPSPCAG